MMQLPLLQQQNSEHGASKLIIGWKEFNVFCDIARDELKVRCLWQAGFIIASPETLFPQRRPGDSLWNSKGVRGVPTFIEFTHVGLSPLKSYDTAASMPGPRNDELCAPNLLVMSGTTSCIARLFRLKPRP
jgi:hypothetical protein